MASYRVIVWFCLFQKMSHASAKLVRGRGFASCCVTSAAHTPPFAVLLLSIPSTPPLDVRVRSWSWNWRGVVTSLRQTRLNYFQKAARGHGLMRRTFPAHNVCGCVNKRGTRKKNTTHTHFWWFIPSVTASATAALSHQTHSSISNGSRRRVGVVSLFAATRPLQHAIHHTQKIWPNCRHNSFLENQ